MGDQTIRVWPVEGDGYGDMIEYPRYAKYRMEPDYPGAAGDANHTLVVYERRDGDEETELGRHKLTENIVAHAGQPSPVPTASDPALQGDAARNTKGGAPADHVDPIEHREGSAVEHTHEGDGTGPTEHVDNYGELDETTLREELQYRGLSVDGTREDLVRRLRESDQAGQPAK